MAKKRKVTPRKSYPTGESAQSAKIVSLPSVGTAPVLTDRMQRHGTMRQGPTKTKCPDCGSIHVLGVARCEGFSQHRCRECGLNWCWGWEAKA